MNNTENTERPKLKDLEIGAIWERDGRMWGRIKIKNEEVNIFIRKNSFKTEEKHPIYRIYIDTFVPKNGREDRKIEAQKRAAQVQAKAIEAQKKAAQKSVEQKVDVDI